MLNLSEIHPDVRKTLHEIENAMVRDVSPNTSQASVGKKIKDVYAKSTFIRMFSAVDSRYLLKLDKEGKPVKPLTYTKNPEGGMGKVSIMGGELSKNKDGNFKHQSGFREMYDGSRWDSILDNNTTDGKLADRFRPLPGVTSVTVEFAGSMKAIRNASISWTCFSFEDISRLTPHFLAHGKPVVLEWGWSSTKDMSDVSFMDIDKISDGSAYKSIQQKIWDNEGKYDAMAGLIKNFEWKTREDGGFDCTTEITSLGVNTLNQQTKNELSGPVDSSATKTTKENSDKTKFTSMNIPTFEEFISQLDKEIQALCTINGFWGDDYHPPADQPNGLMHFVTDVRLWGDKTFGPYMSWGWMEDNIVSKFLGKINKPASGEQVLSDFRSLVPKVKDGIPDLNDLESVKISNHPNLVTADISEFIFPGQWPFANNHVKDGLWGIGDDSKVTTELHTMINDTRKDDFKPFADPEDASKGYLRNIIIHWEVVKEAFTGVTSVETGMQNLFNKLNEKFGIWNLKVTTSSLGKEGRCMVIDEHYTHNSIYKLLTNESTYSNGKVDGLLYKFNVMNERSIVKTHNLTAKLPSSMQTAAMFGANHSGASTTAAGHPGAVRLGQLSAQTKDESIGEMNFAWSRVKFGSANPEDANANKGELTLDEGPELKISPTEKDGKDKEDDKPDNSAKKAKEKALKAQMLEDAIEKVYVDSLNKVRSGEEPTGETSYTHAGEKKPVFELEADDKKMYDEYGNLRQVGEIKWSEVMKGIITSGPQSSIAQRDLLVPLEMEIEITGIGGIVPGNAFTTSYLPKTYDNWVCFQATDISHNIGTDGWVTSLKGLMRCSGTPKEPVVIQEEIPLTPEEIKELQEDLYGEDVANILNPDPVDNTPVPLRPPEDAEPIITITYPTPVPAPFDPAKEAELEAENIRKERDAANKKKKAEEERKRKEAERKKKEQEKRESKKKKQKKRKLKSTYKGSWNQNDKILYVRQPQWRPIEAGGTKNYSFFGEKPKQPVPFPVRKEYWDRNIERPNETGISKL